MQRRAFLLPSLLLVAFLVSPLVQGHSLGTATKNYCEDPAEWWVHDYTTAGNALLSAPFDGNIIGDCDGDGVPADFDGHAEFAYGGAYLFVDSGDGVTSGSIACYGEVGHHSTFGPVFVHDTVLGHEVGFWVSADTVSIIPPTDPAAPNCGDFQMDEETQCVGACSVTFSAGLDGSYNVFVEGTWGHVNSVELGLSPVGVPQPPPPASSNDLIERYHAHVCPGVLPGH